MSLPAASGKAGGRRSAGPAPRRLDHGRLGQRQSARCERLLERVAEDRQREAAVSVVPVHIEPVRGLRRRTVAQRLPELLVEVLWRRDRHVVGNNVDDNPKSVLMGRLGELEEPALATKVVRHPRVVHDVVPVHRPRGGLQDGGEIQVRDAEPGQVRHDRGGLAEPEAGVQLESVRRARDGPVSHARARSGSAPGSSVGCRTCAPVRPRRAGSRRTCRAGSATPSRRGPWAVA